MNFTNRASGIVRLIYRILAAAIVVLFVVIFLVRPDSMSAITIWPAWFYPIAGFLGAVLFYPILRKKFLLVTIGLWLLFILVCCDEPVSLFRSTKLSNADYHTRNAQGIVRLITLNCGGGSEEALNETVALNPDVVLLQESPSAEEVAATAKILYGDFGHFFYGADSSIICRGTGTIVYRDIRGIVVELEPISGVKFRAVSVHLPTPSTRADLWSRDCWKEYKDIRVQQRSLLVKYKRIAKRADTLCVIGGDFNMPARDAAAQCLMPELKDAYLESGAGLCNTITNDEPMHRIDQIWISKELIPIVMRAFKTKNSDHRMVVCDIKVRS